MPPINTPANTSFIKCTPQSTLIAQITAEHIKAITPKVRLTVNMASDMDMQQALCRLGKDFPPPWGISLGIP